MKEQIIRNTLSPMLIAKKVRELAGLNPWSMHKRMGKKTVQAYLSLERSAKRISLQDYFALERIYVEEKCGTAEDFQELARKIARKE